MPTFYSNDPEGRPVLSAINQAQVAQQDAETRAAAVQMQRLIAMINAGVQRDQTASRERVGFREADSQDTRSRSVLEGQKYGADQGLSGIKYRTDAERDTALNANDLARLKAYQDAITEDNRAANDRYHYDTLYDIAGVNAESRAAEERALAKQRMAEIEARQGFNASGFREFSTIEADAQRRRDEMDVQDAAEVNGLTGTPTWYNHIPFTGGMVAAENAKFLKRLALKDPRGVRFNVTTGADGLNKAVPKLPVTTPESVLERYYRSIGRTPNGSFGPASGRVVPVPGPIGAASDVQVEEDWSSVLPPTPTATQKASTSPYPGPVVPRPAATVVPTGSDDALIVGQVYNAPRNEKGNIVIYDSVGNPAQVDSPEMALKYIRRLGYTIKPPIRNYLDNPAIHNPSAIRPSVLAVPRPLMRDPSTGAYVLQQP